jgi:hypothetical protein
MCTRDGMLLQSSSTSVASVTVVSNRSAAAADGVATSAMLYETVAEAQRFLHRVQMQFGLVEFYVVSRSLWVNHASPQLPLEDSAATPSHGFRLSDSLLAKLNGAVHLRDVGAVQLNTLRVASLSPPLCTLLLPDSMVRLKSFELPEASQCSVLHQSGPLVIASLGGIVGTPLPRLRKLMDTPFAATVRVGDAQMHCTSLAWTDSLLCFNAELGGSVAAALMRDSENGGKSGLVQIHVEALSVALDCHVREVASCGDHVVCVLLVADER